MLIKGEVIPQNLDKAEEILNMFSVKRSSEVALLLGIIMKKKGKYKKAFELFGITSSSGNAEAQYQSGKLFYKGYRCNINKQEAMKMFQMSKKNGIDKSDKFLKSSNLPKLYRPNSNRISIEKKKAEPKNDIFLDMDAESLFLKGFKHYNGEGVPVDKIKAVRYYKMSIDKINSEAMNYYALMLKKGDGIPVNKKKANRYFKMASKK